MHISSAGMLKVCVDMPPMLMHDLHCDPTNVPFMAVDCLSRRRSASCPPLHTGLIMMDNARGPVEASN